jgi:penicillin-binding protein 1A
LARPGALTTIPSPGWQRTAAVSLLVGAGFALGQAALVSGMDALLPDARRIGSFNRPGTLTILSADGEVIQKIGPATREKLTPESLPTLVEQAFIAAEDRRFYQHSGIDPVGIGRALVRNLSQRSVEEGASTITQQLARTVFLSQDVTLIRKLKEATLAGKLERQLSKRQILTEYLNVVYLGSSAYGVADAAWIYFSKTPSQLTLPEAALIAGLPPAPSVYSPLVNPELALQRRSTVLTRMEEAGFIDTSQRAEAEATPLALQPAEPKFWESQAPWFSTWVQQELPKVLSKEQLEVGGLTVRSTLNLQWQRQAQSSINRFATGQMEGALVAMEPGTGMVRAMVGGKDFNKSQFNRAAQALRSPGSTFKLFVYLAALKSGMLPERSVVDSPRCFAGYCPRNFGGRYLGRVSLAVALQNSLNTVAVSLLKETGFDRVIETAKSLGITRELGRFYPMAIGAYEQTLLDMTAAYAAITNRGIYVRPTPFEDILGPDGQLLWSRRADGDRGRRAVASDIADAMLWMLQQVVKGGTGGGAALGDRPVAGKTGTSEGGRDLWFIGSIAQLTTGVWLGYDDSRETGNTSVVATLAWRDFMAPISRTLPKRQFPAKPLLQGNIQPDAKTGRPTATRSGVAATEQTPAAPELPESFAPVPEGTPTNARPSGPGATVAPGSAAPTAAGPGTPPPVTTPPPPVAAPPVP